MLKLSAVADLAKDTSAAGRKRLLGLVTDLFMAQKEDRGEQVSLMFGDIVMKVLGQLEEETRMVLAKRICREDKAPRKVMVSLARDTIAIAEPVLENSPVLSCEDLADIASLESMDHLEAIAGRKTLSKDITSVLVDRGDSKVLKKVAGNTGAEFAKTSFMKLVEKARTDETIQAALVSRNDLPDEAGRALLPMLTEELRERVSGLGADNTLMRLMAERAAAEVAARAQKIEQAREQSSALIRDVASGKVRIDDAVTLFARSDRVAELGMLLAKVGKLPPAAVSQLLFSESDKPLVILCKATGVTGPAYKDVLTMRARRLNAGGLELNAAIQRFDILTMEGALRSLELLRQSTQPPEPADDSLQETDPKRARRDVAFGAKR